MSSQPFRRIWLDFRNGHSIYLAFLLTFINFILITYNFAIKELPFLNVVGGNVFSFSALFIAIYIPAAIVMGALHRRKQYSVENEALLEQNWIWAWIMRYEIRLIEGKATPEETKKVKEYLELILRRQNKDSLIDP